MRVSRIAIGDARWAEFTSSHPAASPFHIPAWSVLVAECYGFEAFVLAVRDTDNGILAGIPVVAVPSLLGKPRWVSLPFSDSCPLLAAPGVRVDEVAGALREHVLASGARELELRTRLPAADGLYPVEVGYNYLLALPRDPAGLHLSKGHRQNRNLAARGGVRVTRGSTTDDVAAFYRLHTLTRRRQGVPVQPRRFFELVGERLLARGSGFVATATLNGEVVAAGLFLTHNGTIVAKYRASDPAHRDTGAGFLVDWEAIAAACGEGYHTLDLGRTDHGEEGQRRYKTGWGAVEEPLIYTHAADQAPKAAALRGGRFSKAIIRHSPLWVPRAIGEVLYRWTA
ncbi:MAG TPA: GNAT family N-acetyltransferase [Propionibacteriaceae bacterium]